MYLYIKYDRLRWLQKEEMMMIYCMKGLISEETKKSDNPVHSSGK